MGKQILVPLDGSALAEVVLSQAAALARATSADLKLLRIVTPVETSQALLGHAIVPDNMRRHWEEAAVAQAHGYLAAIAGQLERSGLCVTIEVLEAEQVVEALIASARREPISTIAMSTHGRAGLRRWVLGSVADQLIQFSPKPVMLVRAHPPHKYPPDITYHTIIVPLDGSPFAEQALEHAQAIAMHCNAALVLLSVVPIARDAGLIAIGGDPMWLLEEHQEDLEKLTTYVNRVAARIQPSGLQVRVAVVDGPPSDQISHVSVREQGDLIVMATHGRGGIRRLWLGSVASQLIHTTDLPLMLIHAQE